MCFSGCVFHKGVDGGGFEADGDYRFCEGEVEYQGTW